MAEARMTCSREPSDAAWRSFGDLAAEILIRVAERRALREAEAVERAA